MTVIKTKNEPARRDATAIKSFDHQLYTYEAKKKEVALTSYYDKMEMVNEIACIPFGYVKNEE